MKKLGFSQMSGGHDLYKSLQAAKTSPDMNLGSAGSP